MTGLCFLDFERNFGSYEKSWNRILSPQRLGDQNWPTYSPNIIDFPEFCMITDISDGLVIRWIKHYAMLIRLV
jgi:hypothetical protein